MRLDYIEMACLQEPLLLKERFAPGQSDSCEPGVQHMTDADIIGAIAKKKAKQRGK
jgi:hypothetical protein